MALASLVSFQEQEQKHKSDYELASLVSFQEQEQKHKSDYELAKARIFLKANTHDSPNYQESSFGKSKSGNRRGE